MKYLRKVIRITAEDSPNVQLAMRLRDAGKPIDGRVLVPGILTWDEYVTRRATWDVVRQCVGLDAKFWRGADLLLYPPDWLNGCEREVLRARCLQAPATALGCDPAEGGDKSSWAVVNNWGLKRLISMKTPDTNVIPTMTERLMLEHAIPPERVMFDRGGGGKQHADNMRAWRTPKWPKGCMVGTTAFGESPSLVLKRGLRAIQERTEMKEEQYVFVNMRAEMAYELRLLMDPAQNPDAWYIPAGVCGDPSDSTTRLRDQLAEIPLLYDGEGRIWMLPKNKPSEEVIKRKMAKKTLVELVGHSPDEMDAVMLAVRAMKHGKKRVVAGAV